MPIVFAAITPHAPVLIPEIGKDNLKKLDKTKQALQELEKELYAAKPESIVIVSPHGTVLDDAFNINLSAKYTADFKDFGDFSLELDFKSDYMSIQQIRAADESGLSAPIVLSSEEKIDHGFSVPLYYLTQHQKNLPVVPITYSALNLEEHYKFGQFLYHQLAKISKRFALVASADLSHKLSKKAPEGYDAKAKDFDKQVVTLIKEKKFGELSNIEPKLLKAAGTNDLRSIVILSGIIEQMNIEPVVMCYENPFGVGYLTCNFKMA